MSELPQSMEDCVYFTRRATPEIGKVIAWVERQQCPKCKKGLMSKPIDEKRGTFKTRAKEYRCTACGYTVEKNEYEGLSTTPVPNVGIPEKLKLLSSAKFGKAFRPLSIAAQNVQPNLASPKK